jgi:RNA polymerase sigma-70 factor (ECF subfamily)
MSGASSAPNLDAALDKARDRWPSVRFDATPLWAVLRRHAIDVDNLLERAEFPSVLLAAACLDDNGAALVVFDDMLKVAVEAVARRMKLDPDRASEVSQRLRDKLLTGRGRTEPKLATYEASGPLGSWLRVCAAREALMIARSESKVTPLEDKLEDALEPLFDPELQLLKADGRDALKAAFQQAFGELSARQKTLLAQTLLDGLTLRQVGRIHGVDASTVSRWLGKARDQLLTRTRALMTGRVDVDGRDFEEIVDLVRSQLDLSISRMLRDDR